MLNSKTVFVLAPHPDDAEVGCGGTIARLVESGAKVYFIVFAETEERKAELSKSAALIGATQCILLDVPIRNFFKYRQKILDELIRLKKLHHPDLVIQPSLDDMHQDHQVVVQEGLRAFKDTNLLGYEATWNNLNFDFQMFVSLEERHVKKKIESILCYKSQGDKGYMNEEYVRSLMKVRGVQIGLENAEVFNVIRQVIK